jgi:hypothetical protein
MIGELDRRKAMTAMRISKHPAGYSWIGVNDQHLRSLRCRPIIRWTRISSRRRSANPSVTIGFFILVEGIVLFILGFLAIVIPPLATLAVTIFLGWLFSSAASWVCSRLSGRGTLPAFGGRFCLPRSASAQASSCSHGRSAVRFHSRWC